jgi:hypothetical protein
MFAIPGLLFSSFAGVLLWSGAAVIVAPSHANALVAHERLAEASLCRSVAPTFDPALHRQERAAPARFTGGARARSLVAAPCPRGVRGFVA